ncbi:MAG: M14 family metallopeptidase, partial [Cryomorphaceae bacterium]|nr:M14 family metallopeptidase [Cryomorphaceae bacterium]
MKFIISVFALSVVCTCLSAQAPLSPDQFLGRPLGSAFTRHYEVVGYFKQLEKSAGDRIKLVQYGTTNENRELLLAFISTPENVANLENIRGKHQSMNKEEKTAIVWLSYNVHGNESAGTEAALQTAYELLTKHQGLLKNTLVILDPCVNPDGRDRYVNWYYQQAGNTPDNHFSTAEHNEGWPSGRPNHYLFDLNRDWMWNTQKETQQRIAVYNQWLPHVHVDFHEQGMNAPYYFAPAAEPYHRVITNWQREFQNGTGKNHAKYFDKNGWFYFTREIFDLLYPSYGDTYPTYCGAIGMTYEQGGSGHGGLAVVNDDGDTLTLTDRLLHHHTTGVSTVEYASEQASALIANYHEFMRHENLTYKSFAFTGNEDQKTALLKLLDAHQIQYYQGSNSVTKGFVYSKGSESSLQVTEQFIVVHTDQPKGAMVEVLFEPKTQLADSLTYDITAWNLPYAYGLEAIASKTKIPSRGLNLTIPQLNRVIPGAYAYLLHWNGMKDARFLASVLNSGIKVRYSENPFEMEGKIYGRGTLIITRADNTTEFEEKLTALGNEAGVMLTATMTGMAEKGNDLGSSSVKLIHDTRIGMIYDEKASSLNVGEVWHFFENELHYPIQKFKLESLDANSLKNLDVLIVPELWSSMNASQDAVLSWMEDGG